MYCSASFTSIASERCKARGSIARLNEMFSSPGGTLLSSVGVMERPLTDKERRTLALHRVVAEKFLVDPEGVRSVVRRNLRLQRRVHGARSASYIDAWSALLDSADVDLASALVDLSEEGRALRVRSPGCSIRTSGWRRWRRPGPDEAGGARTRDPCGCRILGEDTVIIVGSQSIVGVVPEHLRPPAAQASMEVDVLPLDDQTVPRRTFCRARR